MADEMDFNQAAVKCAYPPCQSAKANLDSDETPPFCQVHLGQFEFIMFSVWVTSRIEVRPAEAESKLAIATTQLPYRRSRMT